MSVEGAQLPRHLPRPPGVPEARDGRRRRGTAFPARSPAPPPPRRRHRAGPAHDAAIGRDPSLGPAFAALPLVGPPRGAGIPRGGLSLRLRALITSSGRDGAFRVAPARPPAPLPGPRGGRASAGPGRGGRGRGPGGARRARARAAPLRSAPRGPSWRAASTGRRLPAGRGPEVLNGARRWASRSGGARRDSAAVCGMPRCVVRSGGGSWRAELGAGLWRCVLGPQAGAGCRSGVRGPEVRAEGRRRAPGPAAVASGGSAALRVCGCAVWAHLRA